MNRTNWLMGALLLATLGLAVILQPKSGGQKSSTAATPLTPQIPSPGGNSFVITRARVFDGETVLQNTTVVIRDGLITQVAPDSAVLDASVAGLSVISGAGKTLIPGLIDAHTHSYGTAQRDALRFGVTTELEMMGDANMMAAHKNQRESLAQTDQADLWSAGFAVTVPGGHGTQFGLKVPTLGRADDVAAFVQARVAEGSDYIKLIVEDLSAYGGKTRWPTLNSAQVLAAVHAAHLAKKLAVVHVSRMDRAGEVLQAGADGLVHVFADATVDAAFLQIAKARQAFVVPTLSVLATFSGNDFGQTLAKDTALAPFLSATQRQNLNAARNHVSGQALFDRALSNVRQLHNAGVLILAGTDAGNPGTAHGTSMHGELALLVQSGLSPQQALMAATSKPAAIFGLQDRGHIRVGLRADLILLDGDPLADITATRKITQVWKNGFAIQRDPSSTNKAPNIATDNSIGAFDEPVLSIGKIPSPIRAPYGAWLATSDQMAGGQSSADITQQSGGAKATHGALHVTGVMRTGFAYPWAGAMFMAGNAMSPVNASQKTELIFQVKGDGREYRVMVFSGADAEGVPAMKAFKTSNAWQEIRFPLAAFDGIEPTMLRGFAWAADAPEGNFEFWLDEVELR